MVSEDQLNQAIEWPLYPEITSPGAKLQAGLSDHGLHGKRKDIDLRRVERLCRWGATLEEIADRVGWTRRGMLKRRESDPELREAMERGYSGAKLSVRRRQFQIMLANDKDGKPISGATSMAIWLGKQMLGQRDMPDVLMELQAARLRQLQHTFESVGEDSPEQKTLTIEFVHQLPASDAGPAST